VTAQSRGSPDVTAVIAAHNESANIEACIASVDWTREVIVVENDSIDDTIDRTRSAGAIVISPRFTTIGAARNNAIDRVQTPWVFVLDADERVGLHHFEARFEEELLHERIADLNGRPLLGGLFSALGRP